MPINKRESMIFTMLMCGFMVFIMTIYNIGRIHGVDLELIKLAWMGFPAAYVVALISDLFLVGSLAKKITLKIAGPKPQVWKKVAIMSTSMVCGMVLIMSLFGAIIGVGLSSETLIVWLYNIPANFVVAFPLQVLIAGPLVRFLFRRLFPVGAIAY